jgi:hypothetical protein
MLGLKRTSPFLSKSHIPFRHRIAGASFLSAGNGGEFISKAGAHVPEDYRDTFSLLSVVDTMIWQIEMCRPASMRCDASSEPTTQARPFVQIRDSNGRTRL